jgi:hypothetical protein
MAQPQQQQPIMISSSESSSQELVAAPMDTPKNGQPALLTGGTLRSYQIDGFHWLKVVLALENWFTKFIISVVARTLWM